MTNRICPCPHLSDQQLPGSLTGETQTALRELDCGGYDTSPCHPAHPSRRLSHEATVRNYSVPILHMPGQISQAQRPPAGHQSFRSAPFTPTHRQDGLSQDSCISPSPLTLPSVPVSQVHILPSQISTSQTLEAHPDPPKPRFHNLQIPNLDLKPPTPPNHKLYQQQPSHSDQRSLL